MGWIARRLPGLVREIDARGHEVANHGNSHHLCTNQTSKEVYEDLKTGKKYLEDIIGKKVYGYRAPSFAINNDILEIVKDTGHVYDSSFNSFALHERYGTIDLPESMDFFELPISNLSVSNKVIPLGGGGYFRLLPFPLFKLGMNHVLDKDKTFLFYSHPWEFDPGQPRVEQASNYFKFRHYINLSRTHKKLDSLIKSFATIKFLTCMDYLRQNPFAVS